MRNRSWNPLICHQTVLPEPFLVSAKLIAFYFLFDKHLHRFSDPFLPLLPFFDFSVPPDSFRLALQIIFVVSAVTLIVNRFIRLSCALMGLVLMTCILINRTYYQNTIVFFSIFLILLGLYEAKTGPWFLRVQVALMYAGAWLNKILDVDWRSGQFAYFWTHDILKLDWFIRLESLWPGKELSAALCWFVILSEAFLFIGFLMPRLYHWAIAIGFLFHFGMLLFTKGAVSFSFFYVIFCSYFVFYEWPKKQSLDFREGLVWHRPMTYFLISALLILYHKASFYLGIMP